MLMSPLVAKCLPQFGNLLVCMAGALVWGSLMILHRIAGRGNYPTYQVIGEFTS